MLPIILTLILIVVIFLISRILTNEIYFFFRRLTGNGRLALSLMVILFLPGTVIHESAHLLAALFLLMPVKSMSLFPVFEKEHIKLGSVTYERKDPVRGLLVGIAPFFAGMAFLFSVFSFGLFPGGNPGINILFVYLISVVSLTMFSSPKDLQDFLLALPPIAVSAFIFYAVIYVFQIDGAALIGAENLLKTALIINGLNKYLFLSILIQGGVLVILRLIRRYVLK